VNLFLILAALLVSVALAFIVIPLSRDRSARGLWTIALVVTVTVLGAGGLYWKLGNRDWAHPQQAETGAPHSIDEMVAKLEAKLAQNPGDIDGWLMLGRSYFVQNNYPKAIEAFGHAYDASKGQNVEAIVSYAEAMAVSDQKALTARAGELFESALAMDPSNQKALWYGGMAQAAKGSYTVARERWLKLIAQDLPPDIKPMLADRIRELDKAMGRTTDAELDRISPPGAAAPVARAADETPAAPSPTGMTVHVHIEVSPAMKAKIPPGAPLFVLARDPSQPGPPFAARRLSGVSLPTDLDLSEQDAMMPGRTLKDAHQLQIVARYSASGQPQAASGDVYGQAAVTAGAHSVRIVIDQQMP
jgi:cytochrome c-type biogenesis protein CcmH